MLYNNLSSDDARLLRDNQVTFEYDQTKHIGVISFNGKRISVKILNKNNIINLNEKNSLETAQRIALIILKKNLVTAADAFSRTVIDSRGIKKLSDQQVIAHDAPDSANTSENFNEVTGLVCTLAQKQNEEAKAASTSVVDKLASGVKNCVSYLNPFSWMTKAKDDEHPANENNHGAPADNNPPDQFNAPPAQNPYAPQGQYMIGPDGRIYLEANVQPQVVPNPVVPNNGAPAGQNNNNQVPVQANLPAVAQLHQEEPNSYFSRPLNWITSFFKSKVEAVPGQAQVNAPPVQNLFAPQGQYMRGPDGRIYLEANVQPQVVPNPVVPNNGAPVDQNGNNNVPAPANQPAVEPNSYFSRPLNWITSFFKSKVEVVPGQAQVNAPAALVGAAVQQHPQPLIVPNNGAPAQPAQPGIVDNNAAAQPAQPGIVDNNAAAQANQLAVEPNSYFSRSLKWMTKLLQ